MVDKFLSVDDIKSLPDVPEKVIEIPQWKTNIKVKGISKKMQIELGRLIQGDTTDAFDYQKELLKASVIEPALDDESIDMLYEKDASVIDLIFAELNELNGVGSEVESALADEFQEQS